MKSDVSKDATVKKRGATEWPLIDTAESESASLIPSDWMVRAYIGRFAKGRNRLTACVVYGRRNPGRFFNLFPNPTIGMVEMDELAADEWHGFINVGATSSSVIVRPYELVVASSLNETVLMVRYRDAGVATAITHRGRDIGVHEHKGGMLRLCLSSESHQEIRLLTVPPSHQWPWIAKRAWRVRNVEDLGHSSLSSEMCQLELAMQIQSGIVALVSGPP